MAAGPLPSLFQALAPISVGRSSVAKWQVIKGPGASGSWKILFVSSVDNIDSLVVGVCVGVALGLSGKPVLAYSLAIAGAAFVSPGWA